MMTGVEQRRWLLAAGCWAGGGSSANFNEHDMYMRA
jgi:hypothetical protein